MSAVVEIHVLGEWLIPVGGPPRFEFFRNDPWRSLTLDDIWGFGFVEVDHPEHGRLRICPGSYPIRSRSPMAVQWFGDPSTDEAEIVRAAQKRAKLK